MISVKDFKMVLGRLVKIPTGPLANDKYGLIMFESAPMRLTATDGCCMVHAQFRGSHDSEAGSCGISLQDCKTLLNDLPNEGELTTMTTEHGMVFIAGAACVNIKSECSVGEWVKYQDVLDMQSEIPHPGVVTELKPKLFTKCLSCFTNIAESVLIQSDGPTSPLFINDASNNPYVTLKAVVMPVKQ